MIDKALDALQSQLLAYVKSVPDLNVSSDDAVMLSPLVKDDGTSAIPKGSLGITLVNIEEERTIKSQLTTRTSPEGVVSKVNPEIALNLFVLVTASFNSYSYCAQISYRQYSVFFKPKMFLMRIILPGLDTGNRKDDCGSIYTLSLEQQNHLWGYMGAKYTAIYSYIKSVCW